MNNILNTNEGDNEGKEDTEQPNHELTFGEADENCKYSRSFN